MAEGEGNKTGPYVWSRSSPTGPQHGFFDGLGAATHQNLDKKGATQNLHNDYRLGLLRALLLTPAISLQF